LGIPTYRDQGFQSIATVFQLKPEWSVTLPSQLISLALWDVRNYLTKRANLQALSRSRYACERLASRTIKDILDLKFDAQLEHERIAAKLDLPAIQGIDEADLQRRWGW